MLSSVSSKNEKATQLQNQQAVLIGDYAVKSLILPPIGGAFRLTSHLIIHRFSGSITTVI